MKKKVALLVLIGSMITTAYFIFNLLAGNEDIFAVSFDDEDEDANF